MKGIEMEANKVDPKSIKEAVAKRKYTQKEFMEAYIKMCAHFGLQLAFAPQWKQSLDNGSYSMVIQPIITEYIEPPKEG
jgi:hypothetical protein